MPSGRESWGIGVRTWQATRYSKLFVICPHSRYEIYQGVFLARMTTRLEWWTWSRQGNFQEEPVELTNQRFAIDRYIASLLHRFSSREVHNTHMNLFAPVI